MPVTSPPDKVSHGFGVSMLRGQVLREHANYEGARCRNAHQLVATVEWRDLIGRDSGARRVAADASGPLGVQCDAPVHVVVERVGDQRHLVRRHERGKCGGCFSEGVARATGGFDVAYMRQPPMPDTDSVS